MNNALVLKIVLIDLIFITKFVPKVNVDREIVKFINQHKGKSGNCLLSQPKKSRGIFSVIAGKWNQCIAISRWS